MTIFVFSSLTFPSVCRLASAVFSACVKSVYLKLDKQKITRFLFTQNSVIDTGANCHTVNITTSLTYTLFSA